MNRVDVSVENYLGWPNTYRLSNGLVEVRVVTDVGPRIMDLHTAGGANLLHLHEPPGGTNEPTYKFRGGWRLWVAPERTATTYALDNEHCEVQRSADGIVVTAPPQPQAGIQKRVAIRLTPGVPRVSIESTIRNVTDHVLTYAAWSLPMLAPGGRAFVPLDVGPPDAFEATRKLILWSYTRLADPRYQFGDRLLRIDHWRVAAPPAGQSGRRDDESKIGSDSAQGWVAYLLDRTLLVKRFPHPPGAYPDGGATIEVYSNHDFLELEHLGPLTTIGPGEAITFPEEWWLFTGVAVPEDEAGALAALHGLLGSTEPRSH